MSRGKGDAAVGAGAIGCSAAYHRARLGVPSLVMEREAIAARGSGNSRALCAYPPRFTGMEGRLRR